MKKITEKITEQHTCRISGEQLKELFTLGELHLSDFLSKDEKEPESKVELKLVLAPKSGLVQMAHNIPGDLMYRKYWYKSSVNASMRKELNDIANLTQSLIRLKKGDLFIDIGCNDGTFLSYLSKDLIRIGFDPNDFKRESQKHANLIINDYFNYKAFSKTKYGKKKAKIVTSIAMFYDLADPGKFVEDIKKTLDNDGLWVIQMSYLPLMLEQLAFDNICHEHTGYYTLTSLKYLLDKYKMKIVDCQLNDVYGGSFRIFIRKENAKETTFANAPYRDVANYRLKSVLAYEKTLGLNDTKIYKDFWNKIQKLKRDTMDFIKKEKKKGKKIWGYGASTKGNTLLQWFGLDSTLIDGIADASENKFGLRTVGTNIPIHPEDYMRKEKPDYLLVLPWHFISEFKERERKFLEDGGKFIVPCPRFEIIEKE